MTLQFVSSLRNLKMSWTELVCLFTFGTFWKKVGSFESEFGIRTLLAVLTVHRTTGKNRVCQMNKHLLSKKTPSSSEHHDLDVCSHHLPLMYITMGWIIFSRNFLISQIKQFSPDIYLNCRYYILIDEIAPHFAQLTQNLTSDCWLI